MGRTGLSTRKRTQFVAARQTKNNFNLPPKAENTTLGKFGHVSLVFVEEPFHSVLLLLFCSWMRSEKTFATMCLSSWQPLYFLRYRTLKPKSITTSLEI